MKKRKEDQTAVIKRLEAALKKAKAAADFGKIISIGHQEIFTVTMKTIGPMREKPRTMSIEAANMFSVIRFLVARRKDFDKLNIDDKILFTKGFGKEYKGLITISAAPEYKN